jgi:hypothetical protein
VEGIEQLYGVAKPWMEHAAGFARGPIAGKFAFSEKISLLNRLIGRISSCPPNFP